MGKKPTRLSPLRPAGSEGCYFLLLSLPAFCTPIRPYRKRQLTKKTRNKGKEAEKAPGFQRERDPGPPASPPRPPSRRAPAFTHRAPAPPRPLRVGSQWQRPVRQHARPRRPAANGSRALGRPRPAADADPSAGRAGATRAGPAP